MFAGLVGIFLNAIETNDKTWLQWIIDWLSQFSSNVSVATVVLLGIVVGAMLWIAREEKPSSSTKSP